ncbi:hypothetical protein GOBAR_DD23395 [Gossypium barbadense]|nr:hypothetical protein GOBAR_DD23395 [Gossypium barbadense]
MDRWQKRDLTPYRENTKQKMDQTANEEIRNRSVTYCSDKGLHCSSCDIRSSRFQYEFEPTENHGDNRQRGMKE